MKNLMIFAIAMMAPALAAGADTLNDAQITAIVVASNQIAIDAAELAESKASNDQVKAFARRMVSEHTHLNRQTMDLATKLNITPEETVTSRAMKSDARKVHERLEKLQGKTFDHTYMYDEVAFHKQVTDMLGSKLLPSAQNKELKDFLAKLRPLLFSHLNEAERILSLLDAMR